MDIIQILRTRERLKQSITDIQTAIDSIDAMLLVYAETLKPKVYATLDDLP